MSDKDDINYLLARYERAIHDKDAAAVIACYSENAVAYDLAPPLAIGARSLTDPAGLAGVVCDLGHPDQLGGQAQAR